jgi:flagellar FliL protein
MLKKILNILNIISQTILLLTAILSLFTAYVIFAPDTFPKPFRLVYNYGDTSAVAIPVNNTQSEIVTGQTSSSTNAHEASAAESETQEFSPGDGIMVDMSTKIINLLDPAGRRYIRLTVVVEIAPENPDYKNLPEEELNAFLTEFDTEIQSKMPVMDDVVITLLSTKPYEELYTAEGKEALRAEILQNLSEKLPSLHILAVYFTEFVVQ